MPLPLPSQLPAEQELPYATLEQAAEWFAVLGSGQVHADEHRRWQAWLAAHADHRQAWARVEAISNGVGLARAAPQAASAALQAASQLRDRHQRRKLLKAMALVALTAGAGWQVARQEKLRVLVAGLGASHRTGVGERRQVVLADGTRLWLDTDTVLDARYDDQQRLLVLHQGVILVETHADTVHPARPLIVRSRQGTMRALGTRFSVRQLDHHASPGNHGDDGDQGNHSDHGDDGDNDNRTQLAVSQGRVQITPLDGPPQVIAAGSQTSFTRNAIAAPTMLQPDQQAWTQGMLIARDLPLAQFLAQLARYRSGHLGCDPAIAGLRVVGAFPLHDTGQALAMLEAALPVRVRFILPWWVTVSAK